MKLFVIPLENMEMVTLSVGAGIEHIIPRDQAIQLVLGNGVQLGERKTRETRALPEAPLPIVQRPNGHGRPPHQVIGPALHASAKAIADRVARGECVRACGRMAANGKKMCRPCAASARASLGAARAATAAKPRDPIHIRHETLVLKTLRKIDRPIARRDLHATLAATLNGVLIDNAIVRLKKQGLVEHKGHASGATVEAVGTGLPNPLPTIKVKPRPQPPKPKAKALPAPPMKALPAAPITRGKRQPRNMELENKVVEWVRAHAPAAAGEMRTALKVEMDHVDFGRLLKRIVYNTGAITTIGQGAATRWNPVDDPKEREKVRQHAVDVRTGKAARE